MVGTFAIMALIGIVIGLFSGMLGIGGGMVMVPLFRLVFGMSAVGSTATSLFTIIPTSVSGAISHARAKTCVPKLGIALGVGGACTSWLGVWLAQLSHGWLVMLAAAAVIAYSGITMFRKALKAPKQSIGSSDANAPVPEPPALSSKKLLAAAGIGHIGIHLGHVRDLSSH